MITEDLRKVNGGGTALASGPCDPGRPERQINILARLERPLSAGNPMRYPALPAIVLVAACSTTDPPGPCTADLRPGIVVTIRDANTGEAVAGQAMGQVEDSRYVDSLRAYAFEGTPSVMLSRAAAFERPGTYEVTVFADGYQPWVRDGVRVDETRDGCHVLTVELEADLEPRS